MNCPEVMELMQRHLDEDLDTREEAELAAHLQGCLDCRVMLERLQELSNELAQLPKVLPPFSLVDSILPQLDAIDRQAAGLPEALAAGDGGLRGKSEPVYLPYEQTRRARRTGSPISWRLAGGVVAAGLIIGFFAFNVKQPSMKNADSLMKAQSQSAVQESARRYSADEEPKAAAELQVNDQADITLKRDQIAEPSAPASDAGSANAAGAAQTAAPELVDPQTVKPKSSTDAFSSEAPASEPSPPGVAPSGKASKQPLAGAAGGANESAGALRVAPNTGGGGSGSTAGGSPAAAASPSEDGLAPNDASGGAAADTGEAADAPQAKSGASMMLVGPPVVPVTLVSPDGVYVASIEDGHVAVRQTASQELVFASGRVWNEDAVISLTEWSADGKLVYQVETGGQTLAFVIDAKAHTETAK